MNILFATLVDINDVSERGIYQDLTRELANLGHNVFIISPAEKRHKKQTLFYQSGSVKILKVRIGNITKTNWMEKGISTILMEFQFVKAVRRFLNQVRFDIVIYSTPPITLAKLVTFIKKRDGAASYLLLKDIFPQNAIDLGLFSKDSLVYRIFRKKELNLYHISDYIGCMSPANVEYVLNHNEHLEASKVHVCPNSITPVPLPFDNSIGRQNAIREKYGIPVDSKIFVYGGNLGKPQCVPFIIECLKQNKDQKGRYFLICGDGTDARLLKKYIKEDSPNNVRLLDMLPKDQYGDILSACDVGLIFLDNRFTIPNFPSRLLSYMEYGLPVLACTDPNTDVGKIIEEGKFGWQCASDDPKKFTRLIEEICEKDTRQTGLQGRKYLEEKYLASQSAKIIMDCACGAIKGVTDKYV